METICQEFGISSFSCNCVSWGLYFQYFLFFAVIIALIVMSVINMIKIPKDIVKNAMATGGFIILFLFSYLLSGSEISLKAASLGVTAGSSKFIGAGLIMFYLTLLTALIAMIISEIKKILL